MRFKRRSELEFKGMEAVLHFTCGEKEARL
jgi:hypothetical protein